MLNERLTIFASNTSERDKTFENSLGFCSWSSSTPETSFNRYRIDKRRGVIQTIKYLSLKTGSSRLYVLPTMRNKDFTTVWICLHTFLLWKSTSYELKESIKSRVKVYKGSWHEFCARWRDQSSRTCTQSWRQIWDLDKTNFFIHEFLCLQNSSYLSRFNIQRTSPPVVSRFDADMVVTETVLKANLLFANVAGDRYHLFLFAVFHDALVSIYFVGG